MLFLNTALLLGAIGISIPIVIHLLNRRSNRVVEWGAMNFLLESLAMRSRRIRLEEALLMGARCLLAGLLALALARPFVPPGSTVPWLLVLPLLLLGVTGLGVATVLHDEPRWRRRIGLAAAALLLGGAALIVFERQLNLSRFSPAARQDVALIIDSSTSMTLESDGISNFERAVEEARSLVLRAPRGHAFSLVQGGPSPGGRILDPTTDRVELESALDDLAPLDGPMAVYEALTLASLSLARGDNPAKQIIVITDGQELGWEIGRSGRWEFLRDAFRNLPTEPQILLRTVPVPGHIRNLAVTGISLSRDIVGVDRPVEIAVEIENAGNEAVTPGELVLDTDDGQEHRDRTLGQIRPGERRTVRFTHQFSEAGAHALAATLDVEDDIAGDNTAHHAVNVAREIRVLIVDGRPSGRTLDRASSFAAVALAPSSLTLDPALAPNDPAAFFEDDEDFDYFHDPTLDPIRFLVEPEVVDAPDIASIPDFGAYDVIVLGDVPRLPAASAAAIAAHVERGGGLLVAAGARAQAGFYNQWTLREGVPLLPALLDEDPVVAPPDRPFHPSARSLRHPALQKIAEVAAADFGSILITSYRGQTVPEPLAGESATGALLNDGGVLLSSLRVGRGEVALLGVPLDLSAGNWVTRQSFLPFLHEMVYPLANPAAYRLNLEPGWEVGVGLSGRRGRAVGEGLVGRYFADRGEGAPVFSRQDDGIRFRWTGASPAPGVPARGFSVEWTGKLQVPLTGRYSFVAEVEDPFELWLEERLVAEFRPPGARRRMNDRLDENRWYDFRAVYRHEGGEAGAVLYWETDGLPLEPVPSSAFRSFPGATEPEGGEGVLAVYEVEGPRGRPASARLVGGADGGSVLKLQGEISSGLYRVSIPEEQAPFFTEFLRHDRNEIPFTVNRDPAESRFRPLDEADFSFLANFVTVARPASLEELIGFLQGNQFGRELWKYLALGALFFLLAETALTRWIARSRRMGEEITVKFESKEAPTAAFREQLARMGKGTA